MLAPGSSVRSAWTADCTVASRRPLTNTRAPAAARPRAIARPIPALEPVTRAVFPVSSIFIDQHSAVRRIVADAPDLNTSAGTARIDKMFHMSARFVHLRLHSEFSVVDGLVRIDEAVRTAARDEQGALALTDLGNLFGAVRFYAAARRSGIKPIIGCDLWITHEADRDSPFRLLLLAQDRTGYRNLCELLSRAWLQNRHRDRGEVRLEWLHETGSAGLIALSGGPHGEVGTLLATGQAQAARAAATRLAALFPGRFYLELQRAGRLQGARSQGLHRRGLYAGRYAPAAPLLRPAVLQISGRDGRAVCGRAGGAGQFDRDRQTLQPDARAGPGPAARVSDAAGRFARPVLQRVGFERARAQARPAVRRRGRARAPAPALRVAAAAGAGNDRRDGLFGLFPDRGRLHQLGQEPRHPGRTGARLGCRIAGGLRARNHRPGSVALRPAVRALPESGAGVDAGLRHRFLPGRARPGDRVREAEVRRAGRRADRHVRNAGGQGRGAGRRAGAGPSVFQVRSAVQADSAQSDRPVDARP